MDRDQRETYIATRRKEDLLGAIFGVVVVLPMASSFLAGVSVLAWQAFEWLRLAMWPSVSVRDALRWWTGEVVGGKSTGLVGLDKVLVWCFDGSSVVLWLMLILPVSWLFLWLGIFDRATIARRSKRCAATRAGQS